MVPTALWPAAAPIPDTSVILSLEPLALLALVALSALLLFVVRGVRAELRDDRDDRRAAPPRTGIRLDRAA